MTEPHVWEDDTLLTGYDLAHIYVGVNADGTTFLSDLPDDR